ncbi:hypothetical protein BH23GEM3_BH23GEM3_19800 [soil metagenome]
MEREDRYHSGPPEPPARHAGESPVEYQPPAEPRGPAPEYPDDPWTDEDDQRARANMPGAIRAEDTEPYLALQYVARLFKVAAMVVVVALVAEIVAGVVLEGAGALLPLMAEVIRGVVLASILWGAGDLTLLLIDVGHDVRAARVLLGRISVRAAETLPTADDRVS